jgi:hypothetical protein
MLQKLLRKLMLVAYGFYGISTRFSFGFVHRGRISRPMLWYKFGKQLCFKTNQIHGCRFLFLATRQVKYFLIGIRKHAYLNKSSRHKRLKNFQDGKLVHTNVIDFMTQSCDG